MRLVRRHGKALFLHSQFKQNAALIIGALMVGVAFIADQCLDLDRVTGVKAKEPDRGRRLFYPNDHVIGLWRNDKETYETVDVPDGKGGTKTENVGALKDAPAGRKVGIIVHIIGVVYMLVGLNTVCDIYFCGALDEMVEKWNIQPDVAGATFMAAGGSAPELFTSIIGAVGVESDVGFSTIVGSAVFNVLAVIGCCGMAAREPIQLSWWPLFRDCTFYIISLCLLAIFASGPTYSGTEKGPDGNYCAGELTIGDGDKKCGGGKIQLYEAIILFLMYVLYCMIMVYNEKLRGICQGIVDKFSKGSKVSPAAPAAEGDQAGLKAAAEGDAAPAPPEQKSGEPEGEAKAPGAGAGGAAAAVLAAVKFNSARDSAHKEKTGHTHHHHSDPDWIPEHHLRRLHHKAHVAHHHHNNGGSASSHNLEAGVVKVEEKKEGDETKDEEKKDDDQASVSSAGSDDIEGLVTVPEGSMKDKVMWGLCLPVYGAMYWLIPRPSPKMFLATFGVSLLFIAFYSYWLVYCVTVFSDAILGGGDGVTVVMGFTLLAAGTSIPDLVSSMAVARAGEGDMAVSSSIGSNIFDILVGLPLPWILKIGVIEMGINGNSDYGVSINSPYIAIYVFLLLFMVAAVILSILFNKWYLNKALGIMMSVLYFIFLFIVIPLELAQPL